MWAKQSTAATLIIGPILDSAGAEYTGAVIGDISLSKNGGTLTALASAASLTHIANGQYTLVLTTGNTDTLGRAQITCNKSTYQMPTAFLMVMPANVYNALIAGTDNLDVNTLKVGPTGAGVAQTAGDILTAVSNIAVTSAALNTIAASATYTTGTDSGGYANTATADGVYDSVADSAGTLDFYYQFSLGSTGQTGVGVSWLGYVVGVVNTVKVYAYNWGGATWDQVGTIVGISGTANMAADWELTSAHTGTGGNVGLVRIRFAATGLVTATVKTDRILCGYAVVTTFPTNFSSLVIDASGRVDIGKALGTAVTLDANNVLNVSAKYWAGTAIVATSIPVGIAAGAAGGTLIAGSNAATTFTSFTCSGNFTVSGNWLTTGTTTWTGAAAFSTGLTTNITGTLATVTTLTNAPSDSTGVTTLLTRLTSARGGYLDNLNVGGAVASQADVNAINQSASKHIILTTVGQYERPETGTTTYTVEARTFTASTGAAVNADSTPTLTATGNTSGSLAANLGTASNPATGVYRWVYTVDSAAIIEQIRYDVSATISSSTFTLSAYTQVCDLVSATWTSTDASHLTSIFNKLPSNNIADETLVLAAIPNVGQIGTQITTDHGAGSYVRNTEPDNTSAAALVTTVGAAGAGLSAIPKTGFKLASDGLDSVAATEPSAKPTTFPGWIMWLVQKFRRSTLTSTTLTTMTEAGATVTTQTVSDNGVTQVLGPPS